MNRLLIIEDNQALLELIKERLIELHQISEVETATSLSEAFSVLENEHIDLFIVDIGLPDGSGYDFIRKIRSTDIYRYTDVFIITGMLESRDEIIQGLNENLFRRYFTKPIDLEALTEAVIDSLSITLKKRENDRIQIQRKSVNMIFLFENIVYIETNNKMTTVVCKDGKYQIGRYPLARLLKELPEETFIRTARSFVVNLNEVQLYYKANGQYMLKFHHIDSLVPVGNLYRNQIDEHIKRFQA